MIAQVSFKILHQVGTLPRAEASSAPTNHIRQLVGAELASALGDWGGLARRKKMHRTLIAQVYFQISEFF